MMRRLLTIVLLLAGSGAWAQNDFIRFQKPSVAGAGSGGATFTAPVLLPNGEAAIPSLAFTSDADGSGTGIYRYGTNQIGFATNGIARGVFLAGGAVASFWLPQNIATISMGTGQDVYIERDAANTLALRNSTNAQTFNIYNTYTDGSNYERGLIGWASNIFTITSYSVAGTGNANRSLILETGDVMYLKRDGALRWGMNQHSADEFGPYDDDSLSLGTSAKRVLSAYISRSIQGSKSKTLTDNTATAFVRLSVADDDYEGCDVIYTAYAEDADTDARQVRHGRHQIAILNNSGTEACNVSTGDSGVLVTAGTFTCTLDCAAGTNTVDLRATCDTSLDAAAETLTFEYRLDCPSTLTVTPQ